MACSGVGGARSEPAPGHWTAPRRRQRSTPGDVRGVCRRIGAAWRPNYARGDVVAFHRPYKRLGVP